MFRVAIVGRPNVGKSAMLNRLAGRMVSIVYDQPGVTRDRISAEVNHDGFHFEFVDTGGIGLFEQENTPKAIADRVQMQVTAAIETADLLLLVVDGLEGLRPLDREISIRLRKSGRPLWLVVNKLDLPRHEARSTEFYELGHDQVFSISAEHGRGIPALWSAMIHEAKLKQEKSPSHDDSPLPSQKFRGPRLAVLGRPNVGKSSLVNRLLGDERVIVSEIPGTTRDSVELDVEIGKRSYRLIDTAGMRHKSSIRQNVEMYSRYRSEKSIERCDLALLVMSAEDGPTRLDCDIASLISKYQKPCILLVNKWDLNEGLRERIVEKDGLVQTERKRRRAVSRSEYESMLRKRVPFLDYAPLLFISAKEGYHTQQIWKVVDQVQERRKVILTTGVLNRLISVAQEKVQPPMRQGRRLKIYYVTQKTSDSVPTFIFFINGKDLWIDAYARYLENQIREQEFFPGCPLVFELREKINKQEKEARPSHSRTPRGLIEG